MLTALETYRAIARNAAYGHRVKDVALATDMFTELWRNLSRETPDDHSIARAEFNVTFGAAYRSQWEPGLSPAPAPTQGYFGADSPALAKSRAPRLPVRAGQSVASDCAAFFRAKLDKEV